MEQSDLLLDLQDVDYFLLKEYQIMRNIIDKSPSGEGETTQVKVRVKALIPQGRRLESCMLCIEQGKFPNCLNQDSQDLRIFRIETGK